MKHATKNTKSIIQSNRRRRLFHAPDLSKSEAIGYKSQSFRVSCFMFHEKGFTLIELLMAMSIFALTTIVVVAVFLSMTAGHRRSLNAITLDNAAYIAMETIAKEIRTGRDYRFPGDSGCIIWNDISSDCGSIVFTNYHGNTVLYKLNNGQIEKCTGSSSVSCAGGALTPSNIVISNFRFNMDGINNRGIPDNKQSKISIILTAETPAGTPEKYQRTLNLQTTISSRNLDS